MRVSGYSRNAAYERNGRSLHSFCRDRPTESFPVQSSTVTDREEIGAARFIYELRRPPMEPRSKARCWAVRAGLLTPLTFARHRLSPLAAVTSGAYILHKGRR